jgi:peptide methionine sulfoxide reductase MsrB
VKDGINYDDQKMCADVACFQSDCGSQKILRAAQSIEQLTNQRYKVQRHGASFSESGVVFSTHANDKQYWDHKDVGTYGCVVCGDSLFWFLMSFLSLLFEL